MNKVQYQNILQAVEKKFGKGSCQKWKNKDFSDLSFEIHLQTKVLISPATLKRLFGKVKISKNYTPQENTIQALIDYTGYVETPESKKFNIKWVYALIAIVVAGLIITWTLIETSNQKKSSNLLKGELKLIKVEGTCPSTAFFEITKPKTDKRVMLNFGDDSHQVKVLDQKKQSHFYAYPGYFNAVLQTLRGSISDTVKVLVPTNGWQAFTHYYNLDEAKRYYPIPLKNNQLNSTFHASPQSISSLGVDTTEMVVVRIDNYKKTQYDGDSFTYRSRFKNSSFWPAIRCFSVYLTIQGSQGKIEFKFVATGCSAYSNYILSEKQQRGADGDLSAFTMNQQEWLDVSIINNNKKVAVNLNDQLIFEESYQKSIGEIIGTSMIFHGSGSVDYIYLTSGNNEEVFASDFD